MRVLLAIFAVLVWSASAQATAIYTWQSLSGGANCCDGSTLELSDAAFFSGHADLSLASSHASLPDPNAQVLDVDIHAFGQTIAEDFRSSTVAPGYFTFALDIVGNGLMGSLSVNDLYSDLAMSGDVDLWTVTHYATDRPGACSTTVNACAGETGRWVLTAAPVNEPAGLALLVLGFAGLAFRLRRTA